MFQVRVSSLLSQFGAADRSTHLSVLLKRRPYTPLGSCVFHRVRLNCCFARHLMRALLQGYLIGNHLPAHMLRGVVLLCYAHKLLQMTAANPDTEEVVWTEVFFSEDPQCQEQNQVKKEEDNSNNYRHFLLAVAVVCKINYNLKSFHYLLFREAPSCVILWRPGTRALICKLMITA